MEHIIPAAVLERSTAGAVELERTPAGFAPRRLGRWTTVRQYDEGIERMAAQTLGVRLRLSTRADALELAMRITRLTADATAPARAATILAEVDGAIVDRVDLDEGDRIVVGPGTRTLVAGGVSHVRLALGGNGDRERPVTVWLAHTAEVEILGGRATAPVAVAPVPASPRWVHHGSSISHGGEADGPLGPWPQQTARELGFELTNLAFAGNAMLDPFVAQTIATTPADLITLKLGINVVNGAAMRARAFVPALHGFLDRVREGHPHTPIVVVSPIYCPGHETTPGPTREVRPGWYAGVPRDVEPGDGELTLQLVRTLMAEAVARRDDPGMALVNGLDLLGERDAALLDDGLHPGQAGHDLIGARFAALLRTHPIGAAAPRPARAGG